MKNWDHRYKAAHFLPLMLLFLHVLSYSSLAQSELFLESMKGFDSNEQISDLALDNEGNVWVASAKGLSLIQNENEVAEIEKTAAAPITIAIGRSGKKYVGHSDNSLTVNGEVFYTLEDRTQRITDIEIHKQNLYVGTTKGIYAFDLSSTKLKKHYTERNSLLVSNYINFVFSDSEERLWIGTKNGIVLQKSKDTDFSKNYDSKLNYIAACENQEGVWLISNEIMWLIESTDNRWVDVGLKKGLYAGDINDIAVDKDGSIYIASDILVKFDPYKNLTERYTDILGIASQKCLALEADKRNIIWLGTSDAGLFKIYKQKKESNVEMAETPPLRTSSILEKSISCKGAADASIRISATGGKGPYSYSWNNASITSNNPSNLGPGIYTVTITDAETNQSVESIEIKPLDDINVAIIEQTRVSNTYTMDGVCEISISGGTAPYTVQWDNGEQGMRAKRLAFGSHAISILDAKGCKYEEQVEIKKPKNIPDLEADKLVIGQTLRINKLYFEADSSTISQTSFEVLDEVYDFLATNENVSIEIGGHTNNIPPHEYCDRLSEARAREVATYLYGKGIYEERISFKGYGKRNPIASNDNATGRRKNQRVEIKILKI